MRILKLCPWVEAGGLEEFSVALDAPVYPPCPYLLAFSPTSDFHSGHAGPLLCVRLEVCLLGVESAEVTARVDIATVARQSAVLTQTVELPTSLDYGGASAYQRDVSKPRPKLTRAALSVTLQIA